ncbi:Acetyl-CoA acetyltransferase [Thalassocella blandensis]|nr:Acetyl-CoA acetyltransferase [Thalassocella blandensis]
MSDENIVIVAAKRTPIGAFMGALTNFSAPELGAAAIQAAIEDAKLTPAQIDETLMGCVLPAGLGQAPARQAALKAGLPDTVGATTINKVCGSGMKAVMQACDAIKAGSSRVVVAGGMESMSNAPYLLKKARQGYRLAHEKIYDHMMLDGLENAYDGQSMGCFAQAKANEEKLSRSAMDEFALNSLHKAQNAQKEGYFAQEICAIDLNSKNKKSDELHSFLEDEGPLRAKPEKIPLLKPAFALDGTITAANSSSISDGAAALVLMTESEARRQNLTPLASITGYTTHAMQPAEFTVAPVHAIDKLLQKVQWSPADVDAFEINEAFAMVTMLTQQKLDIDPAKINLHGGACALGHPIGASGARIIVTLVHALKTHSLKRGIASLCIGGGEATAIAIEVK